MPAKKVAKKPTAPKAVKKVKTHIDGAKLDVKEIEKAHAENAKEVNSKEAAKKRREETLAKIDAKDKKVVVARIDSALNNPLVKVEVLDRKLPVSHTPISVVSIPGLIELPIHGSHLRLLTMADPSETPNLEQRVGMARRLNEVGPYLPRYIKSVQLRQAAGISKDEAKDSKERMEGIAESTKAKEAAEKDRAEKADERKKNEPVVSKTGAVKKMTATTPKPEAAPSNPNAVPLKKVCAEINIDPRIARRILRSKGGKPGGRWEWDKKEVAGVHAILQAERGKYEKKGD